MTRELLELERQEQRVLGALEAVDATSGARILAHLQVSGLAPDEGARFVRNRSALYVLTHWAPLAAHESVFDAPPALPAVGSLALELRIVDPAGTYLPRRARLALPRNPGSDAASRAAADSLFRPAVVRMFRTAAAPLGGNWARLDVRVGLPGAGPGTPLGDALGGALIELRDAGNNVLARGLTDARGEAVVPVAGVPITTFSEDENAVVVSEIAATVHAFYVASAGTRTPRAQVDAGRAGAMPLVDPDRLMGDAARIDAAPVPILLAARRAQRVDLVIALP